MIWKNQNKTFAFTKSIYECMLIDKLWFEQELHKYYNFID